MIDGAVKEFYRKGLDILRDARVSFMLGGAFALEFYTGIQRDTKDLDIFIHPRDSQPVVEMFLRLGYQAQMTAPYWLAKVNSEEGVIDFVFGSGNGICVVDDHWFDYAVPSVFLGVPVMVAPVEEITWSKAFVMGRDRFDGADVAHLLRSKGSGLDWSRLLERFQGYTPLLLNHLVLFSFIYPSERHIIPGWVERELLRQWRQAEAAEVPPPVCRGTLLSRVDFQGDLRQWGYLDARLAPFGNLTEGDLIKKD
jgi:hypothetical protein